MNLALIQIEGDIIQSHNPREPFFYMSKFY